MSSARKHIYRFTLNEVVEVLHHDEDSDMESYSDDDIEDISISDLQSGVEGQEKWDADDDDVPLSTLGGSCSCHRRGPPQEQLSTSSRNMDDFEGGSCSCHGRGPPQEQLSTSSHNMDDFEGGSCSCRGRSPPQKQMSSSSHNMDDFEGGSCSCHGRGPPQEQMSSSSRNIEDFDEAAQTPVFKKAAKILVPNIHELSFELDCLLEFFPDTFWSLLKTETNRYTDQMKAKEPVKPGSMLSKWIPVTVSELKKFFSIIIHMSLVKKDTLDSYWSTSGIIHTPFPGNVMKRARFRAIYSCLHLNDNEKYIPRGRPNYDPFFKLRPYFDELCKLFQQSYYPGEALTMATFAYKSDKSDTKIYKLRDAETGYILRMIPCVDSKTELELITTLVEPYFGQWHTIYMDYTSPDIAEVFWHKNTRVVGSVMAESSLPEYWLDQPVNTGEMVFCHHGNFTACKWKDVHFLTTKHSATWTKVAVRRKGETTEIIKPNCVLDYNKYKRIVDLNDQYVTCYCIEKRYMKRWKKMFFHLVSTSIMQAYIMYKKSKSQSKLKFTQFLNTCGESLLQVCGDDYAGPSHGPRPSGAYTRLIGRHFHRRIPPTATKAHVTRVCKVCADVVKKESGKRGRKETAFYCPTCDIPLCHIPCFEKYHTLRDYTV